MAMNFSNVKANVFQFRYLKTVCGIIKKCFLRHRCKTQLKYLKVC